MTSGATLPTDILEQRAAEQRWRIHNSMAELRSQVKEKLDPQKRAREYLGPLSAAATVLGMLFGFGVAGWFTPRR